MQHQLSMLTLETLKPESDVSRDFGQQIMQAFKSETANVPSRTRPSLANTKASEILFNLELFRLNAR
jgi:hypothetical protein